MTDKKIFKNRLCSSAKKNFDKYNCVGKTIVFFVNTKNKKEIDNILNNAKLFSADDDIYIVDICSEKHNFKVPDNFSYFKITGGFQPEKISSLISKKNIVIGISGNISINQDFLDYIDINLYDNRMILTNNDVDDSLLFVSSRNALYIESFYKGASLLKNQKHNIPSELFNVSGRKIKKRSSSSFQIFDSDNHEIKDLYNNKNVHGLWIGNELSNLEILSIQSYLEHGHDFNLYVYEDVKNVPTGTIVKDANKVMSGSDIFKYKKMGWNKRTDIGDEGYAAFSNWFRYALLYKYGGWWVDLDTLCLRKLDIQRPCLIASFKGNCNRVNCGILKMPKNSPAMKYCLSSCLEIGKNPKWTQIGPRLLAEACSTFNMFDFAFTDEIFEPFMVEQISSLFTDCKDIEKEIEEEKYYTIHIYNSMLVMHDYDKNGEYDKNSFIEKLKRKYL